MLKRFRKARPRDVRAGLSVDDENLSLALVRRLPAGKLRLDQCVQETRDGSADWPAAALAGLERVDLHRAMVTTVMRSSDYNLLLVEAPEVPREELAAAVRWRIKSLIDHPVEQAVIDVFEMPKQANPGAKPMVYAVAAPKDKVERHAGMVADAGLALETIDIPELCIRNVASLLPQDADGVAFLYFARDYGVLTVTRQGVLYLIRRIETGRQSFDRLDDDDFARRELMSGISLEVQRSLDYYESHYDQRPLRELVLGPGSELSLLASFLNDELGLRVHNLDLNELLDADEPIDPGRQSDCLLALGAALRAEQAA